MRSTPIPKAKPLYFPLGYPTFLKTLGWIKPQPKISSQPLPPQTLQRPEGRGTRDEGRHIIQEISSSAEGSVKGKKCGRKRILISGQKSFPAKRVNTPFRSEKLTAS